MDEAETSAQPRFTPGVFATVAAADDFLLFKHIMVNKNVELELETRAFFVQAHQAKLANQQAEGQPQQLPPRPSTASSMHRCLCVLVCACVCGACLWCVCLCTGRDAVLPLMLAGLDLFCPRRHKHGALVSGVGLGVQSSLSLRSCKARLRFAAARR